jgi:CAAX protease family protein
LPHLQKLGLRAALLISGFLHGVFHLPAILGSSLYHSGGNPLIVIPFFLATLTVAGVCHGYPRLTTNSVWPAALAHSAFNVFWDRLNGVTQRTRPLTLEYLAGESGAVTLAALTVVAVWLAWRLPRHLPPAGAIGTAFAQ